MDQGQTTFQSGNRLIGRERTSLGGPASRVPVGQLGLAVLVVLVPPVAMLLQYLAVPVSGDMYHNAGAHVVLELFYGFMSLVVAFILFQESRRYRDARLAFMAYAFTTMGVLALAHAVSPPGSVLFVWFHSLSALSGALLLALSLVVSRFGCCRPASITPLAAVVLGTVVVALLSWQLHEHLHMMLVNGGFSPVAVVMNLAAGALFLLVGAAFLAEFFRARETLFLVFAVVVLLLAQSEFMFPYSMLWDVNWWIWHGVRVGVVAVLIVMLAVEFVKGFRQLEFYHQRLLGAMQSVEDSNRRIQDDNQMLAAHAAILQDISQSLDTQGVLDSILNAARRLPGVAGVEILSDRRRGTPGWASEQHSAEQGRGGGADHNQRLVQPLVGRECILGSIQVDYHPDYIPVEEDAVRLQVFANQAAVAMERARLHEELVKRHRHLMGMYETLREVTSSIDLDRILESLLQREAQVLEARYALAYLLSEDASLATIAVEHARETRLGLRGAAFSIVDHPVLMPCVRERRSLQMTLQMGGPERFPEGAIQSAVDAGEIGEALYIPLVADGQVIGCIGLFLGTGQPLGRDELALARALAGQAGFAIHHGRLFRESQSAAEFRTGLGETMMAMVAARDLDAVVTVVGRGAVKLLDSSPTLLCLIDHERGCLHGCVVQRGYSGNLRRFKRALRDGWRDHEMVAGGGAPMCLTAGNLAVLGLGGIESELDNVPVLLAPLNVRDHMLGYMILPVARDAFGSDFVERTILFAQQAALAIETAVLIQDLKQAFVELDNAQQSLVESERLASLGEMAATLSHEIRNPLGTITSSVGLLQSGRLDGAEQRELLELMESEVNRLNHLVSDTLDYARPERVREKCFELGSLVDQIVRITLVRFPELVVNKELADDLPALTGEAAEIQQILGNLLDNAAAATEGKGPVSLRVKLEADRVRFEVSDSGPGIPHEMRDRVFEPFQTTKPDGVGLGLVIVHRIVSNWGGTVDLESEPGKGTRVALFLPLASCSRTRKGVGCDDE